MKEREMKMDERYLQKVNDSLHSLQKSTQKLKDNVEVMSKKVEKKNR